MENNATKVRQIESFNADQFFYLRDPNTGLYK